MQQNLVPRALLKDERGVAFYPQLIIAVMVLMVTATALVKNIWEAHESSLRSYRRMRAFEELQGEIEYWKAELFAKGRQAPFPRANRKIAIETGKRGQNEYVMAEFDPAPVITQHGSGTTPYYEITVSIAWPEGKGLHRETMKTAVNQIR